MADTGVTITAFCDPADVALKGGNKGILELVTHVVAQAKGLAPVDMGRLRNSIMGTTAIGEVGFNESGGELADKQIQKTRKPLTGTVGTATEYAVYQEFGTRRMGAQPYLRPAVEIVAGGGKADQVIAKYQSDEMVNAVKNAFNRRKL